MRTVTSLLLLSALSVTSVQAQAPGAGGSQSVLGGMAGRVESRQLRDRGEESGTRTGNLVGVFVEVRTPVAPLGVLAEAFYAQRGGHFDVDETPGLQGQVQADVLGLTVAPTLRVGVGPVSAYAYGGLMVETPVRTRYTGELEPAYRNPAGQIFAVTTGDAGDFRHRSREILVRLGRSAVR